MPPCKSDDFGHRILSIRVDGNEDDASRFVFAGEFDESRRIKLRKGAVDTQKSKHDQLVTTDLSQRKSRPHDVLRRQVFDDVADRCRAACSTLSRLHGGEHQPSGD
ncbi:MAG TPA: hypothetical protein VG055_33025 [Planctomycetaceae bacterium]|nr:hypothetical protein [Planctomycetaceae bacterium]